jgi:alpha-beta hydrolase superfamily lysophospholipase
MLFLAKLGLRILGASLIVTSAIYFVRAADSRRMPDPGLEHRIRFDEEFTADLENTTDWQAYLRIEQALASELDSKIVKNRQSGSLLDRYSRDSLTFPERFGSNWNLSYEISSPAPRGVAVLIHGLSDSPYSMLSTAETLAAGGYNVVVPRMPGHGFAVGGLMQTRSEDWTAAVRIAVRHARQLPAGDKALLIVGYSNGALLAIDYALHCTAEELPCPNRLILMSPAIAVTPLAVVANWHVLVSWMPYFEKFRWLAVLPEVDPFKFTSFPKRAVWEIYGISQRVHRLLRDPERAGTLPPILTFQSTVDDTVSTAAVVANLYSALPANGSELILYDINRNNTATHLMQSQPADPLMTFTAASPLNYAVTVLHNRDRDGLDVDATTLPSGALQAQSSSTGLAWPSETYSLSHIALPFRSDDQLYGDGRNRPPGVSGVVFGSMAPRGERGVLLLSPDFFLRARYNPFYQYQAETIIRWLDTE